MLGMGGFDFVDKHVKLTPLQGHCGQWGGRTLLTHVKRKVLTIHSRFVHNVRTRIWHYLASVQPVEFVDPNTFEVQAIAAMYFVPSLVRAPTPASPQISRDV